MKSLKGTQTEKNLITAFAGESQARNRYTYFAGKAREEGMIQISMIFEWVVALFWVCSGSRCRWVSRSRTTPRIPNDHHVRWQRS